jgi:hypothetical protein
MQEIFSYWLSFHFFAPFILWAGYLLFFDILADKTSQWDRKVFNPIVQGIGAIVIAVDVYVDIFWGTLLFLQWPSVQRLMLSTRMDDLILNGSGWRQWLAIQIVGRFLEPFDNTKPKQHKTYGLFK